MKILQAHTDGSVWLARCTSLPSSTALSMLLGPAAHTRTKPAKSETWSPFSAVN